MNKYIAYTFILMTSIIFNIELFGQVKKLNLKGEYLGQEKPDLTPKIFAPKIVSKSNEYEFGSVFSNDADEFYYAMNNKNGKAEIRYMVQINNNWTESKKINFNNNYSFNDPFLSIDENRMYFISDMPLDGKGQKKDYDIWYSVRNRESWSEPINAGNAINSEKNEYYISFTQNGTMYFSSNIESEKGIESNYDIYYTEFKNNEFQKPVRMCDNINSLGYEADVFIAPDESYIIFCSKRNDGYGQGDLYISFNKDGKWTKAKNMGDKINTYCHELCPFVTNDGKYFFYTSNKDIYWVDTGIFELLNNNSR
jgi:WD40-like Beta Propeller Repeat